MLYDSLLLNCGGGIINDAQKSKQFSGAAALAIGIGGTGVAALSQLKGKIYQQLEPDNPGEAIPKYEGIQLLAIDSDDTDYKRYRGNCRLRNDEFFSICNTNLAAALKAKGLIKDNPLLNWMDIDHIDKLLSPEGAGGVRQVGRYLLISKAAALETRIEGKCTAAMKGRKSGSIDIYIFAGISGGTGSGCFLDTCYIVRKVCERNGWNAKIMGYFFLPDVVTSKPEVASNAAALAYNNSNGYAAMKELDYLMSLKDADDWFTQNYCATLHVHTQEPPVDMCHLISARQADGTLIPNGFSYGINVASDYAMSYLADVQLNGKDETGLTMRGHLANVSNGVSQIPRQYGANLSYHVMGASNAEIPMTQINTYLAAGFMGRFGDALKGKHTVVSKSTVDDLAKELRITADDVFNSVVNGTPALEVYDIDMKVLRNMGVMPLKKLPDVWATCGNNWLDRASGVMTENIVALTRELDNYDYSKINDDALIGRLFRKLWDYAVDPNYGPYYAAALLDNSGYDLLAAMDGQIKTADEFKNTQILQSDGMAGDLVELSKTYVHKCNKKTYANYKDGVYRWYGINNSISQCANTVKVLRVFKEQIKVLYTDFFKPLCDMLDNLKQTFMENQLYMNKSTVTQASDYTWQILTLDDIKPRLDGCIENLTAAQLINKFIAYLLENSESWKNNDQDKIALIVRNYMLELFKEQTSRNLQDYLFDKYPNAQGDANMLAQEVQDDIIAKVHRSAVPMFWCDPSFPMNGTNIFENSSISVPSLASAVCMAADEFSKDHHEYHVRKTGISDRIFALRFCSGVPLYAYMGITLLKGSYDSAETTASGVGAHLYAYTGRGEDGSGFKDWRRFLPTPMPYSKIEKDNPELIPEGAAAKQLYRDGEACGAIGKTRIGEYAIFCSPALEIKEYSAADFLEDGVFLKPRFDAEKARLENLKAHMHDDDNCRIFSLKNDGAASIGEVVVERTRIDYFIHYPMLQASVREEIAKVQALDAALAKLDEIFAQQMSNTVEMDDFCNLLFYKLLNCTNSMDEMDYDKIAYVSFPYTDKYGDKQKYFLSTKSKDMPYGARFPLYQAFLTYRTMDPKKSVRGDLDKSLAEAINRVKKREDAFVAAWLELVWDAEAIENLREDGVKDLSEKEGTDIVNFYNGLRDRIKKLRDDFPVWLSKADIEQIRNPKKAAGPMWVHFNGENLVLYPDKSLNYAWSQTMNNWVPLNAGMFVLNDKNQWEPIRLDGNNCIIL